MAKARAFRSRTRALRRTARGQLAAVRTRPGPTAVIAANPGSPRIGWRRVPRRQARWQPVSTT